MAKVKAKATAKATATAAAVETIGESIGVEMELTPQEPGAIVLMAPIARAAGIAVPDGESFVLVPLRVATSANPLSGLRVGESKGIRYVNFTEGFNGMVAVPDAGVDVSLGMRRHKERTTSGGKGASGVILFG